jgi:hypothetical protein
MSGLPICWRVPMSHRPHGASAIAGGQRPAIRAKRHRKDSVGMAGQRVSDRPVCGHVPQPHRAIEAPLASVLPSGLNAIDETALACPVSGAPICRSVDTFHSRTGASAIAGGQRPAIRAKRQRKDITGGAWRGSPIGRWVTMSHSRTVPSRRRWLGSCRPG